MKASIFKCLTLAVIVTVLSLGVRAQTNPGVSGTTASRYHVALDTVTNTGLKSMTTLKVGGWQHVVTVSTVNVNLTGTMSGVARLWGSLDGVNYQRIRSTQLKGSQIDSLVIDPNHLTYSWSITDNPFQYYQVQTTGIGTVTFTVAGKYVAH